MRLALADCVKYSCAPAPAIAGLLLGLGLGGVFTAPTAFALGMVPGLTLLSPTDGSNVSGTVTFAAVADSDGLVSLRFDVDGRPYGTLITAGACSASFDTTMAADGPHTVQAVAQDQFGNTVLSPPATMFVNNLAPAISSLAATGVTASSVTIVWTTPVLADSQVEYGLTSSYSWAWPRDYALVRDHAQALTGLSPGTTYHVRALSVGENGSLSASGDLTFRTADAAAPVPGPGPTPVATPPAGACLTPDPFVAFGGGMCVSGGWRFPGATAPAPSSSPSPTPTPAPTQRPGGCLTPDPFMALGGGTCVSGGWLPPGMQGSSGTPTPAPAPAPAPTPFGGCLTPDPFIAIGGGICSNGGWRPRGSGGAL